MTLYTVSRPAGGCLRIASSQAFEMEQHASVKVWSSMELAGSLAENLGAAIKSARRLRGHPVHRETIAYWKELLAHAREKHRRAALPDVVVESLIAQLEEELAAHGNGAG